MFSWRRWSVPLVAAVALVGGGLAVHAGSGTAQAAELNGVIASIRTTPSEVALEYPVRTSVSWCLPSQARAGDTFRLNLPPQLVGAPPSFSVRDAGGVVVATATISARVPATATFTVNGAVQQRPGACGTAWFESRLAATVVPGSTQALSYTTGDGQVISDEITVAAPVLVNRHNPNAWGTFTNPHDQCRAYATECLVWYVDTPAGALNGAVLRGTAMAGTTLECSTLTTRLLTVAPSGQLVTPEPYLGPSKIECTPAGFTATVGAAPAGQVIQVRVRASVSAPNDGGLTFVIPSVVSTTIGAATTAVERTGAVRSGAAGSEVDAP